MVASNFLESLSPMHLSNAHFVDKLIRLYRANECLWNPKSPGYRNLSLKENAWQRITHFFNDELTVDQLKLTIISLRHFFLRERINKERRDIATRETFYQKLQFLEDAEMENDNVAIEAQTKLCNSQINCIVEDTFLIGNSQNSIHSEHVDFGLPFSLSQDFLKGEFSEKQSSLKLPLPPMEFQAKGLQVRALSGNDRSYSKSNYNSNDEYDDFRQRQSRSHSHPPKIQRHNYNGSSVITQRDDYNQSISRRASYVSNENIPINQYDDWTGPQTSNQTKRKILTGKYSKRSSRQKLTDYMYEAKLNEIQNSQYKCTLNPTVFRDSVCRKKSGNDEAYENSLEDNNSRQKNYPNSRSGGLGQSNCICCPRNCQNKKIHQDEYYEDDQENYQNRNGTRSNRNRMSPESEYMNTVPDGSQEQNDDEFQTPEPTSEDYAPQEVPRKKPRTLPYERHQRTEKPYEAYDDSTYSDRSGKSAESRQMDKRPPNSKLKTICNQDEQIRCRGSCANSSNNQVYRNNSRRHSSESTSEDSIERDREPVSTKQSGRCGRHPTSKVASQLASRNISKQVSRSASTEHYATRPVLMSPDQGAVSPRIYCSRNLSQVDEAYRKKCIECPSLKRKQRRRNEEEPMEDLGRNSHRKENSIARTYQDEYEESPSQRFSNRSSRHREDTNSRRRQNDLSEEYSARNNEGYTSNRYDNDHYKKHSEIRSRQPEKNTARNTTKLEYIRDKFMKSVSEHSHNDQNKIRQSNKKSRSYEKSQNKYDEDEEDGCSCVSEEIESIIHPDYADQTVEEYPHVYADENQEEYAQAYDVEPTKGYATECTKDTCNDCPHGSGEEAPEDYAPSTSRDSRKGHKIEEYLDECTKESCKVFQQEYSKGSDRNMEKCKKCCERYDEYSGDDEDSQEQVMAKKTDGDDPAEKKKPCYCEVAVETEIDMTLNDRNGASKSANKMKVARKPKQPCKCALQVLSKVKAGRSPNPGLRADIIRQRSPAPIGAGKSRMASMKRLQKLEDNMENKFQAYDGQQNTRLYRAEDPRPCNRDLYRQPSGLERSPPSNPLGGMSVLGTFQVPPNLAEKTINIVKNHISNMKPLATSALSKVMNMSLQEGSPKEVATRPRSISCTVPIQKSSNPFRLSPVQVFLQLKRCRSAAKSKC
ncbi:uncharacterized protein LOC117784833 isoform X2 [Drosophila innubila]|uniref:uncharacterized protein LOC117784833 isoform X2 n=1 Tax=Drosophila innubila TaxID=198719 RepID=UPI00148D1E02|nr:uncharacterized protein LOC117784833 isoform X2 [Drosophila innubila]